MSGAPDALVDFHTAQHWRPNNGSTSACVAKSTSSSGGEPAVSPTSPAVRPTMPCMKLLGWVMCSGDVASSSGVRSQVVMAFCFW